MGKSFKDNPALKFISDPAVSVDQTAAVTEKPKAESAPDGYRINPMYIEKRTRRVQIVLQPSLYEAVKERAQQSGLSVNDYIHNVLKKATEE